MVAGFCCPATAVACHRSHDEHLLQVVNDEALTGARAHNAALAHPHGNKRVQRVHIACEAGGGCRMSHTNRNTVHLGGNCMYVTQRPTISRSWVIQLLHSSDRDMRQGHATKHRCDLPLGSIVGGLSSFMRAPEMRQTRLLLSWLERGREAASGFSSAEHTGQ